MRFILDPIPVVVTLYLHHDDPESQQVYDWITELNQQNEYQIVTIYTDEGVEGANFEESVPYLIAGPYQLRSPIEKDQLKITLKSALDRHKQLLESRNADYITRKERGHNYSSSDRNTLWITNHYMLLINTLLFLYVAIPFLAPVFMKLGMEGAGKAIYTVYKPLCHQLAFRSWFLFGEQPAYPLELANQRFPITYEELTGHTEINALEARNLNGDEAVGFKVALCQRDIALWGSLFITGVVFSLTGRKWKRLSPLIWLILGVLPILLDGGSQFISSIAPFLPLRESSPFLRTLTGILFGTLTGMLVFPLIEESMNDTRQILYRKKAVSETKPAD